jgi:predicted amidophosphoribosyltransferase
MTSRTKEQEVDGPKCIECESPLDTDGELCSRCSSHYDEPEYNRGEYYDE